jgi:hypothetical protein
MHLFGGEPFCNQNLNDVLDIIKAVDVEKIDLLTNGIANPDHYLKLKDYTHKLHRIGFTYHRSVLNDNDVMIRNFENNVMAVSKFFPKIYVKELLLPEYREQILSYKDFWQRKGIDYKIQDFKGYDRGWSGEVFKEYKPVDNLLIDTEYKHYGDECTCLKGYRTLFIRGFDMADLGCKSDVISCWHDPCVVGNVIENWYEPNYKVKRLSTGIEVIGCKKLYRGTYNKDLYNSTLKDN